MSPEKQLRAFIPVLQEFSLLSQGIVVVLHVSPIHLFLGADTIDILLDIGISVTRAILVGIARIVRNSGRWQSPTHQAYRRHLYLHKASPSYI